MDVEIVKGLPSWPLINDGEAHSPRIIWLLFGVVDVDESGDVGDVLVPGPPLFDDPINDGVIR